MIDGKEIYLGLDISTKTIGVCLLADDGSENGKILELTHITPKVSKGVTGIEELFIKKNIFKDYLQKYVGIGIDHVVIEEPLLMSNNAVTVSVLLRFNGMISDTIYTMLGIVPNYISSYDARKYAFPELMSIRKYAKDELQYPYGKVLDSILHSRLVLFGGYPWTIDKKVVVQGIISDRFPDIEWVYGKNGELKKENFDASDAYVAVYGYLNKKKNGELKFKIENVKEKQRKGTREKTIEYDVKYWDKTEHKITYLK